MANSHVPNSHATPGWKEYKFQRTEFIDALQTKPVDDDQHRYTGTIPIDWCSGAGSRGGRPAFGGLLCAAVLNAACQFSRAHFQERQHHEPLSLNIEFLLPVPQGSYVITLALLHSSASTVTIQANIVPAKSSESHIHCHSIIRIGTLKRTGVANEGIYSQKVTNIPDRMDCDRWTQAFFYHVNPPSSTTRCYTPRGGKNALWSPRFGGRNFRHMWHKLDNGNLFSMEHLPLIADLIPGMPLNYEDNALDAVVKYQMPTISLQLNFLEDIRGEEWLLAKTEMRWLSGARFDSITEIIDDRGRIVATSQQLLAMLPVKQASTGGQSRGRL